MAVAEMTQANSTDKVFTYDRCQSQLPVKTESAVFISAVIQM